MYRIWKLPLLPPRKMDVSRLRLFGRILPTRTVPGSGGPTNIPMDCFGDTSPNGQISDTLPRNSSITLFTDSTIRPEKCCSITHLARSLVNDCRDLVKRPDVASS